MSPEKENPSFQLSPVRPPSRWRRKGGPLRPIPRTDVPCRDACMSTSAALHCAAPGVFNTLRRRSNYAEYAYIIWGKRFFFWHWSSVSDHRLHTDQRSPRPILMTAPSRMQGKELRTWEKCTEWGHVTWHRDAGPGLSVLGTPGRRQIGEAVPSRGLLFSPGAPGAL